MEVIFCTFPAVVTKSRGQAFTYFCKPNSHCSFELKQLPHNKCIHSCKQTADKCSVCKMEWIFYHIFLRKTLAFFSIWSKNKLFGIQLTWPTLVSQKPSLKMDKDPTMWPEIQTLQKSPSGEEDILEIRVCCVLEFVNKRLSLFFCYFPRKNNRKRNEINRKCRSV